MPAAVQRDKGVVGAGWSLPKSARKKASASHPGHPWGHSTAAIRPHKAQGQQSDVSRAGDLPVSVTKERVRDMAAVELTDRKEVEGGNKQPDPTAKATGSKRTIWFGPMAGKTRAAIPENSKGAPNSMGEE